MINLNLNNQIGNAMKVNNFFFNAYLNLLINEVVKDVPEDKKEMFYTEDEIMSAVKENISGDCHSRQINMAIGLPYNGTMNFTTVDYGDIVLCLGIIIRGDLLCVIHCNIPEEDIVNGDVDYIPHSHYISTLHYTDKIFVSDLITSSTDYRDDEGVIDGYSALLKYYEDSSYFAAGSNTRVIINQLFNTAINKIKRNGVKDLSITAYKEKTDNVVCFTWYDVINKYWGILSLSPSTGVTFASKYGDILTSVNEYLPN